MKKQGWCGTIGAALITATVIASGGCVGSPDEYEESLAQEELEDAEGADETTDKAIRVRNGAPPVNTGSGSSGRTRLGGRR